MQMQSTPSLPIELWKQVLTHTSQADRARCSVVSRAFQAAAVAALETVEVACRDYTSVDSLQVWLDNHGQYVKRLQVSVWLQPATLALLACQHLQELKLARINVVVAMGPHSHGQDRPVGLTSLTKLHLCDCTVAGGLLGLSVLAALKDLEVVDTLGDSQPSFPGSVLQHYRLLTRLELAMKAVSDLHFISCLVSLQQLTDCTNSIPSLTRGVLPVGLPASLRVLELRPTVLDPVVLLGLTNLRELRLAGSRDFELDGSAVQLLDAFAAMQQLEELQLWDVRCDWPTASSAAYSSLTASSNLTYLDLEDCRLPVGALEHMLPPAGTLHKFAMLDSDDGSAVLPWQSVDVDRLVMHCPALRSVSLGVESSDDLDRLTRLAALTSLEARFAGMPIDDGLFEPGEAGDFIIDATTQFTRLRDLRLSIAAPGDVAAVLPLTALRQLTGLNVEAWTNNTDGWEDIHLCSDEKPPGVWLDLLKICAEHPGCQTTIVQHLADQQAQLQQQTAQLQQQQAQLAEQQQQATGLASALSAATAAQDEVAAARAEAAAARAQASAAEAAAHAARADAAAARADAAELRDQLAALQAVVQHLVHPQATE